MHSVQNYLKQADGMGEVTGCGRTSVQAVAQDLVNEKDDLFMNWHCFPQFSAISKDSVGQGQVEFPKTMELNQLLKDVTQNPRQTLTAWQVK